MKSLKCSYRLQVWVSFALWFLAAHKGACQWVNDSLTGFYGLVPQTEKRLEIQLNSFQFLRNNEYFTPIQDGETILGGRLTPLLQYHTGKGTSLIAGAFMQLNYGEKGFYELKPVIGIRQKIATHWQLNLGYLNGAFAHKLREPLLGFESALRRGAEQGIQFQYTKGANFLDIWIDWMEFQKRYGAMPERFTAGVSSQWSLTDSTNKGQWYIPFQVTAYHQGGQLDTLNQPVYTRLNALTGLGYTQKSKGWISEWGIESCVATTKRPTSGATEKQSLSFWNHLYAKKGCFELGLSFWQGNHYISNRGGAIYGVVPEAVSTQLLPNEKQRQLLIFRLGYSKALSKGVYLAARAEYFQDLTETGEPPYNYGLYLNANLHEVLYRFKN